MPETSIKLSPKEAEAMKDPAWRAGFEAGLTRGWQHGASEARRLRKPPRRPHPPPPALPPEHEVENPSDPFLVAWIAQVMDATKDKAVDMRNPIWRAGYQYGLKDLLLRAVDLDPESELALAKLEADRLKDAFKGYKVNQTKGETPQQKSARIRRTDREQRDHNEAIRLAELVNRGESTDSARKIMGTPGKPFGDVRARRLRKLAVKMGWLERHRKPRRSFE